MLLQRRPAPPLAAFVEKLWASERPALAHARERSLPTGRVDWVIPLRQAALLRCADESSPEPQRIVGGALQGACDRVVIRGGTDAPSSVIGVHFKPGGAAALLGRPMGDLNNLTVSHTEVLGPAAGALHDRLLALHNAPERLALLEAWLQQRLASTPRPDPALQWAIHRFEAQCGRSSITAVQRETGLSPARFIARFRDQVGLTPKRFCRVSRFQAVLARVDRDGATDWPQLALDAGYCDQAHLIHEFQRLAGLAPTLYRPVAAGRPNHVAFPIASKKSTRRAAGSKASWADS